ncbi:hypothetical protein [Mesorhizobium tamadayense]|uniref:hypothetical protein n=1 Tax=Mesorhizobium tamadayense TaxID=425306 RepID=UPI00197DE5D9|nr:hypothetical protein [Mesorhizobium tamadayense]
MAQVKRPCQRFVSIHGPMANLLHCTHNDMTAVQYRELRTVSLETSSITVHGQVVHPKNGFGFTVRKDVFVMQPPLNRSGLMAGGKGQTVFIHCGQGKKAWKAGALVSLRDQYVGLGAKLPQTTKCPLPEEVAAGSI